MNTTPTSDEKIMAALVHGSIFLAFLGPIVPIAIWMSQRKKSKYVCLHALQAMGYQVLMFWLWIVIMILVMILAFCLAFPLSISLMQNSRDMFAAPFAIQLFIFIFIFGSMALFFLAGIVGAVLCLLGRDFRYPFLGKRLERYLSYGPDPESKIDETREDNWVAGICHATAILQLWGIVTPLIVWFTQKERSAHLRFQAMQALIYQGIALAAYLIGMALYLASLFGMFFVFAVLGATRGNQEIQSPVGGVMLILFGIIMLIWLAITILMPVYYLLAAWASIRTIQGRPFRYPLIGRIIARRMEKSPKLEPAS